MRTAAQRFAFWCVLSLLGIGGGLAMLGDPDYDVSLAGVLELWGDVLRDVDQFGLKLIRVSPEQEMRLGRELLAASEFAGRDLPGPSGVVDRIGQRLVSHLADRRIAYRFRVVSSPEVNAFALPGGQIIVTDGMIRFLESEAELAVVIAHEIAHVDRAHCIAHYQYALAARDMGLGPRILASMAQLARELLAVQYAKYQELEADALGVRLAREAGYDPRVAPGIFERMQRQAGGEAPSKSRTPVGEMVGVALSAAHSYLESHPTSWERKRQLDELVERYGANAGVHALRIGEGVPAQILRGESASNSLR